MKDILYNTTHYTSKKGAGVVEGRYNLTKALTPPLLHF
jgi:hypothetical protein